MKFDILSLFPDFIEAFFDHSIIKRAIESGRVEMAVTDPRTFSKDKHHHVDDTIYGGGAGMLMQCGPLFDAVESVLPEKGPRDRVIFLSPAGQTFTQDKAKQLYRDYDHLVLICGHYEGVDHRVEEYLADELISIGDYVLTGGELPAMVMIDAISRLVPGVLNNEVSAEFESFHDNLLEYPQYTRPAVYHEKKVPDVLLSGNHAKIEAWRREQSIKRTLERRPDLLKNANLSEKDKKVLAKLEEK